MNRAGRRSTNMLETVDVGIGIVGFFAFAFLVITVICELTGTDALGWALALLVFVLVLAALLMFRRRITRSTAADSSASVDPE
jgi:predicted RND superfamily exporter protein